MRRTNLYIFSITAILAFYSSQLSAQANIEKAWSTLQSGLADKGDDRAIAVRLLGLLEHNPKAAEIATAALDDKDAEVRASAAHAVAQMQARSALSKLTKNVKAEKEPGVVMADARALIALGDPLGYAVYYAVLTGERKSGTALLDEQKKMLHDPKKMAQFGFEQGIGYIPFASVGLGAFRAVTKDDSSPVRAAAARILAKDPDPKSGDALVEASSDKSWTVRAAALDALSLRGDPSFIEKIESKLDDDKAPVRYTAAAALIHLHDVQTRGKAKK